MVLLKPLAKTLAKTLARTLAKKLVGRGRVARYTESQNQRCNKLLMIEELIIIKVN